MKKYSLLFAMLVGMSTVAFSGWFLTDEYEPVQISTRGTNNPALYTVYRFDPPGSGKRYCFTDIVVSIQGIPATGTFYILEGGLTTSSTAYAIDISSGSAPVSFKWDRENALCLTPGVTGYFRIDGGSVVWKMNGTGFIKK